MGVKDAIQKRRLIMSNLHLLLSANEDETSSLYNILSAKEAQDLRDFRASIKEYDLQPFEVSVSQIVTFMEIFLDNQQNNRNYGFLGKEAFLTQSCAEVFYNLMIEYTLIAERSGLSEAIDIELANRRGPEGEKIIIDGGGAQK